MQLSSMFGIGITFLLSSAANTANCSRSYTNTIITEGKIQPTHTMRTSSELFPGTDNTSGKTPTQQFFLLPIMSAVSILSAVSTVADIAVTASNQ